MRKTKMLDTNLARKMRDYIASHNGCTQSEVRNYFGSSPDFQETWEWMVDGGPADAGFVVFIDSDGVCRKGPQWEFDKEGDYDRSYQNPCFTKKNATTKKDA